ncbi:S-adenosyl-L-methionine-dependent methyltransferase, partial [Catenaria anguillulae PL171]
MRAGHSLLGGTYTRGNDAGDSVFYGFYYHDAHRLVRDRALNAAVDLGKDPAQEGIKGLMIGYGIGVAAHAYVHSGVPLDIVELDKHVLDLARAYFPLPAGPHGDPANATFHVADGRKFVEYTRGASYDFVIHDVFSGGSVPSAMFTWETFAHMRRVLKPGGTLSVNFVGRAHELAFRHVAKTLRAVFPYVRCFAEMPEGANKDGAEAEVPPTGKDDVANYVFYASSQPMDFRPPETRDAFNSMMRTYALHKRMENEVAL